MPDAPKPPAKPKPKSRFRRSKRIALAALALLCLVVLTVPIWSVWLAKPILRSLAGIEAETIEATSWDHWRITSLQLEKPNLSLQAETIELPSPTALAFQHFSSNKPNQSIVVENWTLATIPSTTQADPSAPVPSLNSLIALTNQSLAKLDRYLLGVDLKSGTLRINQVDTLAIAQASLTPTHFSADLTYLPQNLPASLAIDLSNPASWNITAQADSLQLATQLYLLASDSSVSLDGSITTSSNPVSLSASWTNTQTSYLPETAQIQSKNFDLDKRYPFWGDAPPMNISGSANWADERFDYRITGFDTSSPTESPLVLLTGGGTFDHLEIGTAKVELPWLSMENDQPIVLDFNLQNPLAAAHLEAKLDLERIPFIEAKGKLDASLQTKTSDTGLPIILADFKGTGIELFDTTIEAIEAKLDLLGTTATLHSLSLNSAAGSILSANGSYDIANKQIAPSQITLDLQNESQRLRDLVPSIDWQHLTANLDLRGPLLNPELKGNLALDDFKTNATQAFAIAADFEGSLANMQAHLKASNPLETIDLSLVASKEADNIAMAISELVLAQTDGTSILSTKNPFAIRIQKSETNLQLSDLLLSAPNSTQIAVDSFFLSPASLSLDASLLDFNSSILNHWLASPLPPINFQDLEAQLILSETNSSLSSTGVASWPLSESSTVDLSWLVNSDPDNNDSLIIDHLEVGADAKHILIAEGHFPVSVNWVQNSLRTQVHQTAPLSFTLESSPHPDFWKSLEELLPIALTRPVIKAELSGTLENPEGNFDLKLASLVWRQPNDDSKTLDLQDIEASLFANSGNLAIRSLKATTGRNHLEADATLPLGEVSLADLIQRKQALDLTKLTGHANIALDDLETLKAWLPSIMRYEGRANVDIAMQPDDLQATVTIENLATRPLPPLGAISKLTGKLLLKDGIWTAPQLTGLAEKSPFTLKGAADLSSLDNPNYDLTFSSKEFPLLRDSGLLFTGDIDLQLVSEKQAQPTLKGDIRLTKGLFLVEPDLLAGTTKTVHTRPPYFAVEQAPFSDWGLDIAIRGDKFLRVSNSFFEGTLSADFDLEGTLGTPLLIGKANADSGRIFFPASSLKLTQGQALITRDRPSELQIDATAQGRLFAYDVNLNITGPTEKLDLVLTTNPALTQVDALLLLTTGAVPNAHGDLAQKSATSLGIFIGKGLFRKLTGGNSDAASKLNLEVGKDITYQNKKTIEASYELTETLEVEGEYDKRDEFSANLKWTIFKR